jgi:hypothetical protein
MADSCNCKQNCLDKDTNLFPNDIFLGIINASKQELSIENVALQKYIQDLNIPSNILNKLYIPTTNMKEYFQEKIKKSIYKIIKKCLKISEEEIELLLQSQCPVKYAKMYFYYKLKENVIKMNKYKIKIIKYFYISKLKYFLSIRKFYRDDNVVLVIPEYIQNWYQLQMWALYIEKNNLLNKEKVFDTIVNFSKYLKHQTELNKHNTIYPTTGMINPDFILNKIGIKT